MQVANEIVLSARGVRFGATVAGEGPTVLCVHGFPDTRRSFRHQLAWIASRGYRVVAPSLRGYEVTSQGSGVGYHAVDLADDIEAWMDALGEERVHLVGHDWGAIAAYAAATRTPQRFRSLTTIAVPHLGGLLRSGALGRVPRQLYNSWYIVFFQFPWLPERLLRAKDGAWIETLWRSWSPGWSPPAEELELVKAALLKPGVIEAALGYYRALASLGASARESAALHLSPIRVPTMAITGQRDGCIDTRIYDQAMREEEFAAGLRVHRVPDAGHFPHQEKPDVVNDLLLAWLRETDAAGLEQS